MRWKGRNKVLLLMYVCVLITIALFNPLIYGRADKPIKLSYSWSHDTFSAHVVKTWDDQSFLMNDIGSYSDSFNNSRGYAISDTEWMEEDSTFIYDLNYSYVSNMTLTGTYSIDLTLEVYRVMASYGDSYNLIWVGLDSGSFEVEYDIKKMNHEYTFENEYVKNTTTTYRKYDLETMKLLETWNDTIEEKGGWVTESVPPEYEEQFYLFRAMDFTAPLVFTYQVYTTESDDKIAWAELFSDLWIYNDTDKNGIYSLGESSSFWDFGMHSSDECRGVLIPYAIDSYQYIETNVIGHPELSYNFTEYDHFPTDKTPQEIASTIEFTPPTGSENSAEWGISYPNSPTWGMVDSYYGNWDSGWNNTYENTNPMNFSYGFNLDVNNSQADLDLTTQLSKISNDTLYDAVQGLSLAIPHYTYFVATDVITQSDLIALTVPVNRFAFDAGSIRVAEIEMELDKKSYYLENYPKVGENRTFEALGSTVSQLIVFGMDAVPLTPRNWFLDIIYAIQDLDLVKNDPLFSNPDSLFNIVMQNYPVWSGRGFSHDPTFSAFFKSEDPSDSDNFPEPRIIREISGYTLLVFLGAFSVITITIGLIRLKKYQIIQSTR